MSIVDRIRNFVTRERRSTRPLPPAPPEPLPAGTLDAPKRKKRPKIRFAHVSKDLVLVPTLHKDRRTGELIQIGMHFEVSKKRGRTYRREGPRRYIIAKAERLKRAGNHAAAERLLINNR